ncbi:MAG: NnrS family protein [Gammaproteobacteria bacterium]|jgi:uncharacterized protein involved in response to NO
MKKNKRGHAQALTPYQLLFPLAALFAGAVIPLWLHFGSGSASISAAAWHGHEMLFGYTLAVIAGFLATRKSTAVSWMLVVSWAAARVAVNSAGSTMTLIAGISFPLVVLIVTVPPLFAAAKRRENKVLPVLVTALAVADIVWWLGQTWLVGTQLQTAALLVAIDLISLLLLLIGGRALRAAAGGHVERQGKSRRDRGQRGYELPLAALLGGTALGDALAADSLAGALCLAAAVLTLLRVAPWQLQHTLSKSSLWPLALGYLWLVPGLLLKGLAQLGASVVVTDMLHGIGIGALGTLTLVMMARTALLRTRQPIMNFGDIGVAALLLSAAAVARLIGPLMPSAQQHLLWFAAIAWCCAFLVLLARFAHTGWRARSSDRR